MNKAILIDNDGNANGVFADVGTVIGETGTYNLIDDTEVDYSEVTGEIVEIEM